MLSRKPTAIKLTQEDIQDYDTLLAQQQQESPEANTPSHLRKPSKGKEAHGIVVAAAATAQERQSTMDERIGVNTTVGRGGRR
jgi:hypothetical protein